MIRFERVSSGNLREASFALAPGRVHRLLLASDDDLARALALVYGEVLPDAGEVFLFDRPLGTLAEKEHLALLARAAFVQAHGGFVSNLKVWENILLPLWYHGDGHAARREEEAVALLQQAGIAPERLAGFLQALPGRLDAREQRLIGLVRAMLKDPELIVYADPFEGLDAPTRARFEALAVDFHGRRAGRTSLFLSSWEEALPARNDTLTAHQTSEGGFTPWR